MTACEEIVRLSLPSLVLNTTENGHVSRLAEIMKYAMKHRIPLDIRKGPMVQSFRFIRAMPLLFQRWRITSSHAQ
eukprot:9468202-Pyramimonas_sp.AAC.1